MPETPPFDELIRGIRAGDQDAAAALVRHYEPTIKRIIRFRMVDARLGAALDSMDVCQSVMASFFLRAAAGQYELNEPDQLVQLLVTMARNKLASQARKERAQRRDRHRRVEGEGALDQVAGGATPSRNVAARELLEEAYRRFSPDERELVELRNQGMNWDEIAARLGEPSPNLRKRLSRALDRVSNELGLDGSDA